MKPNEISAFEVECDHVPYSAPQEAERAPLPRDGHIPRNAAATLAIVNADQCARRGLCAMHAVAEADDTGRGIQNIDWTIRCSCPESVSVGESAPSSAGDRHRGM